MDILFLKIILSCSVVGWAWVDRLTTVRAIFGKLPLYYPDKGFIQGVLRCSYCLSGWLSIWFVTGIFMHTYGYQELWIYPYIALSPFFAFATVSIIKNDDYVKYNYTKEDLYVPNKNNK